MKGLSIFAVGVCFVTVLHAQGVADVKTPAVVQVQSPPDAVKNERLAILLQERTDIMSRLTTAYNIQSDKASSAKDKADALENIARLNGDMQAIEREIDRVSKQPAISATWKEPEPSNTKGSTVSQTVSSTASPKPPTDSKSFEAWDVFKNFSKGAN